MDPSELLENYKRYHLWDFRHIVQLLNQERKWETIVHKLRCYRIPIVLHDTVITKMSFHPSPAEFLLDQLIIRSCTVRNLMEILEDCKFLDPLSVLMNSDDIEIRVQPGESDQVMYITDGQDLKLQCYAIGRPPLSYQWYCFNEPLKECTQPELTIKNFGDEHEGDYYCIISRALDNALENQKTSNTVICRLMQSLPEFIEEMESEFRVPLGQNVKLIVEVLRPSRCEFQWLKGNTVLDGETSNVLKINNVTTNHEGIYKCLAFNMAGEVYSSPCELKVQVHTPNRNTASAKVALLIANEKYKNHHSLQTPRNDVIQLAEILKRLNFHVITLINLSLVEMRNAIIWFCEILPPKAYAFFYFCGHGFEICNNKFMMPVDCPLSFLMTDCFCDQEFIQQAMLKTKLKLLVIILDMCLTNPDRTQNPKIFEERAPNFNYTRYVKCNMIRAFATSSNQNAYESVKDTNGLYMKCLSKYLSKDEPLLENLHDAHEDFARTMHEKQKPSVSSDDCRRYKLTDSAVGVPDFDKKILEFTSIGNFPPLYFAQIERECHLIIRPHMNHVLNAVDLTFPKWIDMRNWIVSADCSEALHEYEWFDTDDGCYRLALYNIQRAKSDIYLAFNLYQDNTMVDFCHLDLGRPFMSKAHLWFQAQAKHQEINTNHL